ncbi:MAG: peptidoglycan endopeptidase [Verrucomicrobia bacterium]|nr:peptidoglycan endopeptidase [Verrucomicrobiota bacterium]
MAQAILTRYAIARSPTPVFNTPELASCFGGADGSSLLLDQQGLMRTVETVLFPDTKIKMLEQVAKSSIWRIQTDEYAYQGNYYIDERFVSMTDQPPPPRKIQLPSMPEILKTMKRMEGTRYIWGGNWPQGIDLLPHLYPCKSALQEAAPHLQDTWRLKGVDCSGFLHYATNGWTPRNTSSLLKLGDPVSVEGMNADQIVDKLEDLDLIVWAGHVVCVLDGKSTIESRLPEGVVTLNSTERIMGIMKERKPVDNWASTEGPRFVVRRWHPDNLHL